MSSKFSRRGVRPLKPPPVCRDKDQQREQPPPPFEWPGGSLYVELVASSGMDFDSIGPETQFFPAGTSNPKILTFTGSHSGSVAIALTLAINPTRASLTMTVTGGPFPGVYSATAPGWDGFTLPADGFFDDQAGLTPYSGPLSWNLT
jgi:hypothetical protein